jgi:flagellar motor switch protein FliG
VVELDDVPATEAQAVLAEFLAGQTGGTSLAGDDPGLEVEISTTLHTASHESTTGSDPAGTQSPQPFAFLSQYVPEAAARVLSHESVQTIAAVIAQLEPLLAARILEALSPNLATEALERMASLGAPSPAALAEIANHLREALDRESPLAQAVRPLAALQALLAEMNQAARDRVLQGLARRNSCLAKQLGCDAEYAASDRFQFRIEPPGAAPSQLLSGRAASTPLVEFEDLFALSDGALRRVLAAAEPGIVLLALTGAPESLLTRIFSQLPPAQAAILRKRIACPGPVRLSDIAAAQEEIAAIARRLADAGAIVLTCHRHFAAAA